MKEFVNNIKGFTLFAFFYLVTVNFQTFINLGNLGNSILINILLYISILILLSYTSCSLSSSIICFLVIIISYVFTNLFYFPRDMWIIDGLGLYIIVIQVISSMNLRSKNRFNTNMQKIYIETNGFLDASFFEYLAHGIIKCSSDSVDYLANIGYASNSDDMFTFIMIYYLFSVDIVVREKYKVVILDSLILLINKYISTQRIIDTKHFYHSLLNIRKTITTNYNSSLNKCIHAVVDDKNLDDFEFLDFNEFVQTNLVTLNKSFELLS